MSSLGSNYKTLAFDDASLCHSHEVEATRVFGTPARTNFPGDESIPDSSASDSCKALDAEEEDTFDMDGLPLPRLTSSTVPVSLEVARRSSTFNSGDPLFQGVCLYSGNMSTDERQKLERKGSDAARTDAPESPQKSWLTSFFAGSS
eukprot:Nitzschia sp. Nitz4//scaffold6_size259037//135857//136297//NITZ4_001081-RA/size259037-processed-gene-0.76-mRNA-1//-1//CDS//3329556914//474//frame0